MENQRRVLSLLFLFATAFHLVSSPAYADGCFLPAKGLQKLPAIPTQRAYLHYNNGTEMLVVESSLDADGQSFGWILPLPAEPGTVEAMSPGFLKTLTLVTQPHIQMDRSLFVFFTGWIAIVVGLYIAVLLKRRYKRPVRTFLIFVFIFFAGLIVLTPGLLQGGRPSGLVGDSAALEVLSSGRVGNYDVAVLRAKKADALDAWLDENGYAAIPKEGASIVVDYISKNWVFLASRLVREAKSGPLAPHPLKVAFNTPTPVYPMRLTALARTDLYLELYVAGDREARAGPLPRTFADRYLPQSDNERRGPYPAMRGETFGADIGHPEAQALMGRPLVLTKLAGTVKPAEMREDFRIDWVDYSPHIGFFYSPAGARDNSVGFALCTWAFVVALLGLVCREVAERKDTPEKRARIWPYIYLPATAIAIMAGIIFYSRLPVTEVGHAISGYTNIIGINAMRPGLQGFEESTPALDTATAREAEALFLKYCRRKKIRNIYTGGEILAEDSPGNVFFFEYEGRITVSVYNESGNAQPMYSFSREDLTEKSSNTGKK
jgi:hypothetical protein